MFTRQEIKAQAKDLIRGKIGQLFLILLIIAGVSIAISTITTITAAIPILGLLVSLALIGVSSSISLGMILIFLNLTRGIDPEPRVLFERLPIFLKAFGLAFMVGLFTFLWSLLLFVPGIIKAISYSMSLYIMAENPDKGIFEAIDESKKMMEGRKMDYFVLSLSFIGWMLLVGVTFGIASIYVFPYYQTTLALFYNKVKGVDVNSYNNYQANQYGANQYNQYSGNQYNQTASYNNASSYPQNDPQGAYTQQYQQPVNSVDQQYYQQQEQPQYQQPNQQYYQQQEQPQYQQPNQQYYQQQGQPQYQQPNQQYYQQQGQPQQPNQQYYQQPQSTDYSNQGYPDNSGQEYQQPSNDYNTSYSDGGNTGGSDGGSDD